MRACGRAINTTVQWEQRDLPRSGPRSGETKKHLCVVMLDEVSMGMILISRFMIDFVDDFTHTLAVLRHTRQSCNPRSL